MREGEGRVVVLLVLVLVLVLVLALLFWAGSLLEWGFWGLGCKKRVMIAD